MRRRDTRPPADDPPSAIAGTALQAGVLAILLASVVALLSTIGTWDLGPHVGDILVFRRNAQFQADWEVTSVPDLDQLGRQPVKASCVLRPDVMTVHGGSIVVEQRSAKPMLYRVHWAGPRTSQDGADCGSSADLTLTRADLQMLINAVGGVGVVHRPFVGF